MSFPLICVGECSSADWPVGASRSIALADDEGGGVRDGDGIRRTVVAKNVFATLDESRSQKAVAVAKCGDDWYLIQARCP